MSQSPQERYYAGLEAERAVARHYLRRGYRFVKHRHRGTAGEIDLIVENPSGLIFIEVKKSRSHGDAASALSAKQLERISNTAAEFLGQRVDGLNSDVRIDLATVDQQGRVDVIENAVLV